MTRPESDAEFWARQPDVVDTSSHGLFAGSDDASGEEYDEPDAPVQADDDWDDMIPERMSLRDHAGMLRSPYKWDGDMRYPQYTNHISREIRDSDGRKAWANEGHVIEHNTHNQGPVLGDELHGLAYPWMHTYYPAGMNDDEGMVKGYNRPEDARRAADLLSTYGPRHPEADGVLDGYRYVGSKEPYDPSFELPHEAAMRENSGRA